MKIQIFVAIITYCLVAVVQREMRLERYTYEVLQILSVSLTDKTPPHSKIYSIKLITTMSKNELLIVNCYYLIVKHFILIRPNF